jgi:hypothetical protein
MIGQNIGKESIFLITSLISNLLSFGDLNFSYKNLWISGDDNFYFSNFLPIASNSSHSLTSFSAFLEAVQYIFRNGSKS